MGGAQDDLVGTVIGERYSLESLLGRGGMASVYRARDLSLGRAVAVKVFAASEVDQNAMQRESGEIRLLASLNHYALVTLFDAAVDTDGRDDRAYFVMELVEGPTLGERVTAGPIAHTDVAMMLVDLAEALHVVHDRGVVHRDIKPANILLSPSASPRIEFRAKLSDFGIAYIVDSTRLTTPGTIVGTAAYVSPEQATGTAPGPASDIYSLGLVVLESLTGTRAFGGSMVESLSARLVSDPLIPAALGADWGSLLTRMTSRVADERPTAVEVADAAREIERALYSPTTADLEETAALAATGLLGETAVLGATAALEPDDEPAPTRVLGGTANLAPTERPGSAPLEPTRVLPAADEAATERFAETPPAAEAAGHPSVPGRMQRLRGLPRRVYVAAAGIVVIVGALVIGLSLVPAEPTADTTPTDAPTLAENSGDLGAHLDQLLESVTP